MTRAAPCLARLLGLTATAWATVPALGQETPRVRYDGQKVVRVQLDSPRTISLLEQVSPDCWSHHVGVGLEADYRVRAEDLGTLDGAGVRYEVIIDDVQRLIDEEQARLHDGFATRSWFDDFKNLAQISGFIDGIVGAHPGIASRLHVGSSLEQREIFALRLTAPGDDSERPAIFLDATQHAREWISTMSVLYIADALANGYLTDASITRLLDTFVVYIVPVVNPDGYDYTWTTNRLWRKNKRVVYDKVYGVDPNRNWGYKWGLPGSSDTPTSDEYRGTAPFSEPETAAMRDFMAGIPVIAAYIDFHSYGQLVLSPWGYTSAAPDADGSFIAVGTAMTGAILNATQARYKAGITNTLLYPISGSGPDWLYGVREVPSWTIELTQGPFTIAPSAIIPTGTLSLAAVLSLSENVCPADFDHNGFVNGDDSDFFAGEFVAGHLAADFDHNGYINGDDIDFFVKAFVNGCF